MTIHDPIESLSKLPKPQIAALKKLGILTVQDLLLYFPYRYLDFSRVKTIKDLKPGEMVSVKGEVKSINSRFSFRGRMSLAEALISDNTGTVKIIWFNQPYLAKSLKTGEEIFIAGEPGIYNGVLQFTNPIYEKASDPPAMPDSKAEWRAGFPIHTSRLLPLYHLTAKLYNKTLRNLIAKALPNSEALTDVLPTNILANQSLPNIKQTIEIAHFPKSMSDVDEAKRRLAFEEIFINQLAAQKYKLEMAKKKAYAIKFDQMLIKHFVDSLPFKLTAEQKSAAWQILQDIAKPLPMNRLLEGDVGSGKTLVALIAALQAAATGYQVAFLAPTEILARQHYQTALKFLISSKIDGRQFLRILLLTNNFAEINGVRGKKLELQKVAAQGESGLFIGTHALLYNKVKFKKLALVIIDEQHRFGVEQRAKLMETSGKVPHLLSLSATPIPRSLQLAFYGELDVSRIKTKPEDRKPIITRLAAANKRAVAYEFIAKQILQGRQAFVITPLIEESDELGAKSAKKEIENLKIIFPQFEIGLLHGKLSGKEKEAVMSGFLENKIQILVATSVIEVGVDVPNASVMIIEGAERFGLAQLHQFRGRVGRSEHQSHCILFFPSPLPARQSLGDGGKGEEQEGGEKNDAKQRLELFTKTQDGFELAELDLKQRGFGELYGSSQSGWNFKYFDPSYISLIEPAREEALRILKNDINLDKYPLLKAKIENKTIHFE